MYILSVWFYVHLLCFFSDEYAQVIKKDCFAISKLSGMKKVLSILFKIMREECDLIIWRKGWQFYRLRGCDSWNCVIFLRCIYSQLRP